NYGGLRKKIPLTFWAMMIGTLAITGVGIPLTHIGFAGYLSKDAVIESAWVGSSYAFTLLVIAAFMTSFYSWRLMFMTFFGTPKGDTHAYDHAHESPATMLIPLGVLALGAMFAGMIWYNSFFGDEAKMRAWFNMEPAHEEMAEAAEASATEAVATEATAATKAAPVAATGSATTETVPAATPEVAPATETAVAATTEPVAPVPVEPGVAPKGAIYLGADNHVLHHAHEAPNWVKVSPFIAMVLGFLLAFQFYIRRPELPGKLAAQQRPLYLFLLNKWYFDELYNVIFVKPAFWLGNFLWKKGDGVVIDGALNGVAMGIIPFFTKLAGRWQSGYVFTYAFAMVLGIAALLTWMTLTVGH
ncbi:MAG: proton-conducting transporter membrane subunit, partial [Cypionkella sp.]